MKKPFKFLPHKNVFVKSFNQVLWLSLYNSLLGKRLLRLCVNWCSSLIRGLVVIITLIFTENETHYEVIQFCLCLNWQLIICTVPPPVVSPPFSPLLLKPCLPTCPLLAPFCSFRSPYFWSVINICCSPTLLWPFLPHLFSSAPICPLPLFPSFF